MTTTVISDILIQEIMGGSTLTGVAPNGNDTEETLFRGRIRKWLAGTLGGEFAVNALVGIRIEQVSWELPAASAPNVSIYLVDDDDVEYLIDTQNVASGSYSQTNGGFLVPPTFKVRVKSDQAIEVPSITGEDSGETGDGITATYNFDIVNTPIDPSSVSITAGSVTFTDDGAGNLTGAGGSGGTGTVDYDTGAVEITLTAPADFNGTNALSDYDYLARGRVVLVQRQGWGQPATGQTGIIGREVLPPAKG
jgi:hypothetical protein